MKVMNARLIDGTGTEPFENAALLLDEIGTPEPGIMADLVVLDGDPLFDAGAFSRVWCVVQGGKVVYRV